VNPTNRRQPLASEIRLPEGRNRKRGSLEWPHRFPLVTDSSNPGAIRRSGHRNDGIRRHCANRRSRTSTFYSPSLGLLFKFYFGLRRIPALLIPRRKGFSRSLNSKFFDALALVFGALLTSGQIHRSQTGISVTARSDRQSARLPSIPKASASNFSSRAIERRMGLPAIA
jgi:hypothetical protein